MAHLRETLQTKSGEIVRLQTALEEAEDRLSSTQAELKAMKLRYENLKRDEEAEDCERERYIGALKTKHQAAVARLEDELEEAHVASAKATKRASAAEAALADATTAAATVKASSSFSASAASGSSSSSTTNFGGSTNVEELVSELSWLREAAKEHEQIVARLTARADSAALDLEALQEKLASAEERRTAADSKARAAEDEHVSVQTALEVERKRLSELQHAQAAQSIELDKAAKDLALEREQLAVVRASSAAREDAMHALQVRARADA
eukprot:UC1_evm1s658